MTNAIDKKVNLLNLNREGLREFFSELGEKPFRADQVMKWLYHFCVDDFDEMTNLNKKLREKLKQVAEIRAPEVRTQQQSSDGTIKFDAKNYPLQTHVHRCTIETCTKYCPYTFVNVRACLHAIHGVVFVD